MKISILKCKTMCHTYKELKRAAKQAKENNVHPHKRIAILGDTATQCLTTAIIGDFFLRGYVADVFEADYNQVERQILDPTSQLYEFNPEYVIIFQSTHKLLEHYSLEEPSKRSSLAEERLDFIKRICSTVPGRIIYYNYPEIDDSIFGNYANQIPSSFIYQLRKLNYELMNIAQQCPNLFICDLSAISAKYGRNFMYDAPIYMNTEMILNLDAIPLVASQTVDIIAATEGKFKKCLIMDLDNTLWGGIVGDDGWEGIQIGHGLGDGKAFSELQQWIKKLKERGIILAVCSKNDETKAKEPFEKNPEMVLKLNDIAVFIANWENKADNIRLIQSILNIGFDSMVFIDDNPFERNIVREHIQGITVPELPEDPSDYLEFLYSLNLFETASYSENDKDRTKQYQIEAQRASLKKAFTNEADFLKSLNMVSDVQNFNRFNTPRVAQLSQRSNQFNLRTIRYTESEITKMADDNKFATFAFSLTDKFGDNGLIAVVILEKKDTETLFIDTWFMSCRVLKRGMESFTLNTIVNYAKNNKFKRIIGEYLPTTKNQMVSQHYPNLGFIKVEGTPTETYMLEVENYKIKECYITNKK